MSRDDLAGAPDTVAAATAFASLCRTIAALRDKKHGCPWDLQQDHSSLRPYMLEEAYEAVEVMGAGGNPRELCEELGDVLLQVVLNAQVAWDQGQFSIADVIAGIDGKMQRRHPHVFGPQSQQQARDKASLHQRWQDIKDAEKSQKNPQASSLRGLFAAAGIHKIHPATSQAAKIGKIAARVDFDWPNAQVVWDTFRSEVNELEAELDLIWGQSKGVQGQQQALQDELGDVYFSLAQLCRHLDLDPEVVAQHGNGKFLRRFARLEELAQERGLQVAVAGQPLLEELWNIAKNEEY